MPFSYVQYPGNGSTVTFTVPFPYLLRAHVKLYYGLSLQSGGYTQLLVDGVRRQRLGQAARQLAEQRYGSEAVLGQLERELKALQPG